MDTLRADEIDAAAWPGHVASYVTGVIATLVAIGGLYLANNVKAITAMAIVAAGAAAIWLVGHRSGSSCSKGPTKWIRVYRRGWQSFGDPGR